jgi:hypothetical protein
MEFFPRATLVFRISPFPDAGAALSGLFQGSARSFSIIAYPLFFLLALSKPNIGCVPNGLFPHYRLSDTAISIPICKLE